MDHFYNRSKEHLVYDLTRLPELYPRQRSSTIGGIFIPRDLAFHKHLDPSKILLLGVGAIEFPGYTGQQMHAQTCLNFDRLQFEALD